MSRHAAGVLAVLTATMAVGLCGCKARPAGRLETAAMEDAKRWVMVGDKHVVNPLPPTAENIAEGKESFSHYCVVCHGMDGQNTGVPFADAMSPAVPSLASRRVQAYSDGQLHWIIEYGLRPSGMPASRGILTDEEIWSAVVYIRHLPAAGSLGEPAIYSDAAGEAAQGN
ncbi:MAG: cytochrome c [Candidatus Acidiferrales bacterium]